jgi:acyl-CoA synthetase (AMP-forming)/AMP-acid ligase II
LLQRGRPDGTAAPGGGRCGERQPFLSGGGLQAALAKTYLAWDKIHDRAALDAYVKRDHLAASVPRWQLPERWAYIDAVPKTSVGKFSKRMMREAYAQGEYKVIQVG